MSTLRNDAKTAPMLHRRGSLTLFWSCSIKYIVDGLFLGIVATLPILLGKFTPGLNVSLGGTSVIIVVGVALDTFRQLESQMMMRHYKGFLE